MSIRRCQWSVQWIRKRGIRSGVMYNATVGRVLTRLVCASGTADPAIEFYRHHGTWWSLAIAVAASMTWAYQPGTVSAGPRRSAGAWYARAPSVVGVAIGIVGMIPPSVEYARTDHATWLGRIILFLIAVTFCIACSRLVSAVRCQRPSTGS
jgi:hypothetical protein